MQFCLDPILVLGLIFLSGPFFMFKPFICFIALLSCSTSEQTVYATELFTYLSFSHFFSYLFILCFKEKLKILFLLQYFVCGKKSFYEVNVLHDHVMES